MLFEVEISSIEPCRNLVKALAAVVDEGCFNVDEARIRLLAMDPSHVALVDFELPGEFFDGYTYKGGPRFFINISELLKFPLNIYDILAEKMLEKLRKLLGFLRNKWLNLIKQAIKNT